MLKGVLCGKTYKGHLCIANRWFLSITVQLWIKTKAINDFIEKMESVRELLFRFA